MKYPEFHITPIPNSRRQPHGYGGANGGVRPGGSAFTRMYYPGLDKVLDEMKRLVTEYKGNPEIRDKAVALTAGIPRDIRTGLPDRRNFDNIASKIYDWMKKNIAYVRDPDEIEWLQTPLKTLDVGYGDCDDQATLAGALLGSIGVPTRFKVVKADPNNRSRYSHVYLEYRANGEWKPFDTTLHSKAGDGISDSRIYGSRTILLDDCAACGGLSDSFSGTKSRWFIGSVAVIGSWLGYRYYKRNFN